VRVGEQVYDWLVLDELAGALDKVCEADPATLASGEAIEVLHRCLARLEAATTRATAAFESSREWEAKGARSASAWMAGRCAMSHGAASRRVRLGRELRHLPVAEAAWSAGHIGAEHVAALAGVRNEVTEAALARDEALLVDKAIALRHASFRRVVTYWAQHADPDGTEAGADANHRNRRFHLSSSFAGTWVGDMVLDAISGAVVSGEVARVEAELFDADWAEARARLGDAASSTDLSRTPAQRRADALVEMARRSATASPDGRRPEPLFTVLVGYESFAGRICELANAMVVSPGEVARWLDQAWVERVVFDGPSRVIDVGVARRAFAGATRRAVQVRDRECFHESCDIPAEQCQIDHIEPWSAGGATVAANGRPACGHHNRRRHRPP
jgi:hypothetical protein